MRINSQLSRDANLTEMVNLNATVKYQPGDLDFDSGQLNVITPNTGNGQRNTTLVVNPAAGKHPSGERTVRYIRQTLAQNRPSAGNVAYSTNSDTNATIKTKLCALHGLVESEIEIANPFGPPPGGMQGTYVLSPRANSRLYAPGNLSITVKNPMAFTQADPQYFFGASTAVEEGRNVYNIRPTTTPGFEAIDITNRTNNNWSTQMKTDKQNFFLLLNKICGTAKNFFTEENTIIGVPVLGGGGTGPLGSGFYPAYVDFDPGPNSPLKSGGRLYFARKYLSAVASFPVPQALYDLPHAERGLELFQYFEWPSDKIDFIASAAPGSVQFQYYTVDSSYMYHTIANARLTLAVL